METILPNKLTKGDEVRIVAPSNTISLPFITKEVRAEATRNLEGMGLRVSFGEHVEESDEFQSTTIANRVKDIHDAFADKDVKGIIAAIGGFNSNQLLEYLDYKLIRRNPKILCGMSDITALQNAIYAKTGLITYLGAAYFNFGIGKSTARIKEYFRRCLLSTDPFDIGSSANVSEWSSKQNRYLAYRNSGLWILQKGKAAGRVIGGNLCTINLLQGKDLMPDLSESVLFLEDDHHSTAEWFDRDLQALLQLPSAQSIRGLVIGRFQKDSGISRELLQKIASTKRQLRDLPIIANADFGHTFPLATFPIGGEASINASGANASIRILRH